MTSWVRLWHDMPTDPKFRTIARTAKQPLPTVVAVFTFMLADASANENERGRTTATDEDIASAFDIEESDVAAIKKAMQGRVLDGDMLAGWSKRQPKKEDNSAERAKAWRAAKQTENATERSRTEANDQERPDAETDTDQNQIEKKAPPSPQGGEAAILWNDLVTIYPASKHTKFDRAQRDFLRLSMDMQRLSVSQAKIIRAKSEADRQKRGRDVTTHAEFVQSLDGWLRDGVWKKPAATTPVVPMTKLDRELDAELWRACESVMGKPAPTSGTTWSFLDTVIEQARQVAA